MGDLSPHFSRREFRCRCGCGTMDVDPRLVAGLEKLREQLGGRPIIVLSGCRCPEHNAAVGGAAQSQHIAIEKVQPGRAADIRAIGLSVVDLYRAAKRVPVFRSGGVGIYPGERFVHVDVREQPARWARINGRYVGVPDQYETEVA
ncbi:MAG: DUF882 domain-containing protein [Thermoanaerobaculia bacterium]|nr:DUF882 domain-containing protein [Thermoanaerobaculia bacterium]